MSLIREFAIRNKLLYSGFVLPNVQIFFVQKISFATFGVSIDDFLRDTLVWATAYKQRIEAITNNNSAATCDLHNRAF